MVELIHYHLQRYAWQSLPSDVLYVTVRLVARGSSLVLVKPLTHISLGSHVQGCTSFAATYHQRRNGFI